MMTISSGDGLRVRRILSCALIMASTLAMPVLADPVTDATGDFLPTFTGPHNGDLDLTRIEGTFDGATFRLDATTAAPIGTTSTGLYVWGFNRGRGTAGFAQIGASGVLFDSVVIVNPGAGTVTVRDLVTGQGTVLPASAIRVAGNQISVEIPANLLTPQGLNQANFLVNLWPRSSAGGDGTIPDFAPDNENARLTLAFPTPVEASIQTEILFDDASDRFSRIQRRLGEQRLGGGDRVGGFLDVGARFGDRGLGDSLAGDLVSRITAVGIDYAISENAVIGAGLAADRTEVDLLFDGDLTANFVSPEAYFGWRSGALHVDGYGAYSAIEYRSRRILPVGSDLLTATSSFNGDAYSLGAGIGYDLHLGGLMLTPGVDLLTTHASIDGYSEDNLQGFGASVESRSRDSTRLGFGAELSHVRAHPWGDVALRAKARYVAELGNERDRIDFAYTAQPDVGLTLDGPATGADYGALEFGARVSMPRGLRASFTYAPRFDDDGLIDHSALISVGVVF